jgi:ABC-type transport system involved in cytochrome c biogenesis ATPase subunit
VARVWPGSFGTGVVQSRRRSARDPPAAAHPNSLYVLGMAIQGKGYELLGVSVAGGPLTEPVHVELGSGLAAYYGENGAGKTWLLRMMSSALTGVAVTHGGKAGLLLADLHLRVSKPQAPPEGAFLEGLVASLEQTAASRRGVVLQAAASDEDLPTGMDTQEIGGRGAAHAVWHQLALLIDLAPATHDVPRDAIAALYQSADEGLLTLRACGTEGAPAWQVFLAGPVHGTELFPGLLELMSERQLTQASETMDLAKRMGDKAQPIEDPIGQFTVIVKAWSLDNPLTWADPCPYWLPRWHTSPASRAAHKDWPTWLQVPILPVADGLTLPPLQVLGSDESPRDPDADTLNHILAAREETADAFGRMSMPLAVLGNGSDGPIFETSVADAIQKVQWEAHANMRDALIDPPAMRFHMGSVEDWLLGIRPCWQFKVSSSADGWLPLDMLSAAQWRWAKLAIGLASAPLAEWPVVFFCDEPEAGLHRLAERRLATGLHTLALRTGVSVLTATHSPQLLDSNHVRPILVRRDSGGAVATSPVPLSIIDRLAAEHSAGQLGLAVGDLLPLMRLAVVVEGLHDEMVFSALLRDPLDSALAGILPLHGGRHTRSVAEARLLFDGTDAEILLVLDNLEHQWVHEIWSKTRALATQGEFDAARVSLDGLERSKSAERLFLHQLGLRALEVGRMDRIHIHGLSMPDVICYLPPEQLLNKPTPWERVIARWRKDAAPEEAKDLKKWLKTNHLLPTEADRLNAAVESAAVAAHRDSLPLHPDLVGLGLRIQSLGSGLSEP